MKILVISHTYISAINRDKWKVLAQRHPEVELAIIFPTCWPSCLFTHKVHKQELEQEQSSNCTFHAFPIRNAGNEVRYFYHTKTLLNFLKKFRPDLVHIEQGATALSFAQVIACCKLLKLRSCFTFFTWINWKPKANLSDRIFWNFIRRWNINHATGAFAGNQEARNILHDDKFTKPIIVLPQLGVDLKTFYPAQITQTSHRIGYVGRLVPEKGVHLLLQAFARIAVSHPNWKLIFAGKGPEKASLEQAIKQLKLSDRVTIIDSIPHHDIANLMRSLALLVLPSYDTPGWKEQFGHVLVEAMACKIPILASNAGEIPNVIADSGLIFEQKNLTDLSSKLEYLMLDFVLRNDLAQVGYQRVQKFYTHEAIADATYKFWKSLFTQK